MAKALSDGAPLWNGRRMGTVASYEALRDAAAEIDALGFSVRENLHFGDKVLDRNAHSSASSGGWHYAYSGTGAIDVNWRHEGGNTWVETMLLDLYVVPILKKHGIKGILHKPRNRSDHQTWLHADRGAYHDYTVRSWNASSREKAAALIAKYRDSDSGGTESSEQTLNLGSKTKNKALQKVIGTTVDGYPGPNTYAALQRIFVKGADKRSNISTTAWAIGEKYGVKVDGVLSKPSAVIKALQEYLNTVYSSSDLGVDGLVGPATKRTLNAYLADGGVFGHGSVEKPSPDVLRFGSTGSAVRALQQGLRDVFPAYAANLAVDGSFGPSTVKTVKTFQKRVGLKPDGIVGPKTRTALGKFKIKF